MAESTKPKRRLLRPAPQSVRERAERAGDNKDAKRKGKIRHWLAAPFRRLARLKLWRAKFWRPFRFIGRLLVPRYLRNSWRELRLVVWPTRRQTLQLTSAVVMFAIVFGAVVAAFDYGLDKLFKEVILR